MMPRIHKYCFIFLFSSLSIISISFQCYAQSITWQRTYNGPESVSDGGWGVCNADNGNFYIVGLTFVSNISHIYVLKIGPYGDTLWTKVLGEGLAYTVTASDDGGCVLTGDANQSFSVKLKPDGNIDWQKFYGGSFIQCYDIKKTQDRGYIFCGRNVSTNSEGYLCKIDSVGSLQWQITYTSSYMKDFRAIAIANDGGYVVGGICADNISDTTKALLMKVDSTGGLVWERKYRFDRGSSIYSISSLSWGYFLGGNTSIYSGSKRKVFMAKTNNVGDTLFTKIYPSFEAEYFGNLKKINNNKFIFASSVDSASPSQALNGKVMLIDSVGNILRQKIYSSSGFIILPSVLPLLNGDILFVGGVDFLNFNTHEDVYALRTDSLLNAPPPIGIIQTETENPRMSFLRQNYPNPFNPNTTISFDLPVSGHTILFLYDITGKIVKELVDAYKPAGNYTVKIDGSNLASGVYFYRLSSGNYSQTKKMVLIK